jgi:serine/threonine-protein kinase
MSGAGTGHDEQALIGTVIAGRYRLVGILGTGAMGTVYRAEHVELGTPLAIKVLRKHLGRIKEADARFRREAFVGARIVHPNCVEALDFGTAEDGSFYLAMELLQGESLGDLLDREKTLPWRRALHIVRHVLRGLDHAHRESVVHRDIKPDNIFVGRQDDDPDFAKILDFGIAKLVGDAGQAAITAAGITIGTPRYLSPEQATGGKLDGRSDLYSTSVLLYEMLAGRTPFDHPEPLKILTAHASAPVPALADVAPTIEVPPAVEQLVRDGLAKRPDDRIGSAAEYVSRIDRLLEPERRPAVATEDLPAVAAAPKRRSRRRAWLAVAGLVLLAGIGAIAALSLRDGQAIAPPPSAAPRPPTETEPPPAPPEVAAAIRALERGKTCAVRRDAVARLRALGHPAAIPALEKARSRIVRGKNQNACLRAAADAAITELSSPR